MKLLHGSNTTIDKPDLSKCGDNNDFGRGFYLTPNWSRALQMAQRRCAADGGSPVVNSYLFYPSKCREQGMRVKTFTGFTVEWARFVINNRLEENFRHDYDIVIGPVADAGVTMEINRLRVKYEEHFMDEKPLAEFIRNVSQFGHDYIQYCFCTQRAINELIKF